MTEHPVSFTLHSEKVGDQWVWWAVAEVSETSSAYASGDTLEGVKDQVVEMCREEGWGEPEWVLADQPNHYQL